TWPAARLTPASRAGSCWRRTPRRRTPSSPRSRRPSPTRRSVRKAPSTARPPPAPHRRPKSRAELWSSSFLRSAQPPLRGAADAARELDQRLVAVVDVDDAAVRSKLEAHRSLLLAHAIERDDVVRDHLDRRVELLDLHNGRHRSALGGEEIMDVDGVFPRHDAADADDLLPERTSDLAAVHCDRVVGAAAVVAVEHHEAALSDVIP